MHAYNRSSEVNLVVDVIHKVSCEFQVLRCQRLKPAQIKVLLGQPDQSLTLSVLEPGKSEGQGEQAGPSQQLGPVRDAEHLRQTGSSRLPRRATLLDLAS